MKSDELLARLAEINEKYGPIPVQIYNRDFPRGEDAPDWQVADIQKIEVDGMEVEVWV